MIDHERARRVTVDVFFDGVDITTDIRSYFLSMTYTDSEEDEADDLEIQLQDRDGLWLQNWLERAVQASAAYKLTIGAVITPVCWDVVEFGALPTGRFELDSVQAGGPPGTITLRASALPFSAAIRQTKRSKAWEAYRLSGIAREIAGSSGLGCLYESDIDPYYDRADQEKQTDIKFLSELCHDAGISLKCTDGRLVLFDQSAYESKPPVLTLRRGGGQYISYELQTGAADTQYTSCRVSYTDPSAGQCIEGIAKIENYDDGAANNRQLEITAKVRSADEAKTLAEKWLRMRNKFARTASFTLPGHTGLVAGVTLLLAGWGGWDGKYIIKQATHSAGSSGYQTKIALRQIVEGY